MKRKEIEKIPPAHVEKSDDKKFFVAAVEMHEIKGEKHVVIDLYRNLKKCFKQPLIRICVTENDYGNYDPETQVWDKRKLENVGLDNAVMQCEHNISINDAAQKVIFENLDGYRNDSWYQRIESAENTIKNKMYKRKQSRKYELLEERMETVNSIPQEFYDWCENELFKNNKYIFYRRVGRFAEFKCACCGAEYKFAVKATESFEGQFEHVVPLPKENFWGRCDKCGEKAVYKPIGRRDKINDKRSCYFIQKYGENGGVVVRYFEIYKTSAAGAIPVYEDVEINRSFFVPGMKKVQKDYCIYDNFRGVNVWIPNNIPGMATISLKEGALYPGSLEEIRETMVKYCGIEIYQKNYDAFKVENFVETYWRIPALEMILKMGMWELANKILNEGWSTDHYINPDGGDMVSVLGIDKSKIKRLSKRRGNINYLEVLQAETELGINIKEDYEEKLANLAIGKEKLINMLWYMSAIQIINRVYKYSGIGQGTEDVCGHALNKLRETAHIYADYISMRYEAGYDMSNSVYIYPRDLIAEHNKLVAETDKQKTDKYIATANVKYAGIKERYDELCKLYMHQDEEFCIRPAKNAGEIIMEGRILHHCVGGAGYLDNHSKGKSIILFLRPADSKNVPYATIEIKGLYIVQWYEQNDKKLHEKQINAWLKKYLKLAKDHSLNMWTTSEESDAAV